MARKLRKEYGPSEGQRMIRGLTEALQQIQEQAQNEEISNYFEVLRYFQNPPYEPELAISDSKRRRK